MGFLTGTTTEIVSSVIYNLAGDGEPVSYIKSLVTGHVILDSKSTMGESIVSGLLNGPALRMRRFARWAGTSGYAQSVGSLTGTIGSGGSIDQDALIDSISHGVTETVVLLSATIAPADISYWADAFIIAEHPEIIGQDYVVDMLSSTPGMLTITLPDGTVYLAPLTDYDASSLYMYVSYKISPLVGEDGPEQTIIYRQGSGDSLYDSFFSTTTLLGSFFPHIPIRVNTRMIGPNHFGGLYPLVKKAVKKSLPSGDFDKLVSDLISNNPSIGDIDHATIIFGASLVTKNPESKAYIYSFFKAMHESGRTGYTLLHIASPVSSLPFGLRISWEGLSYSESSGRVTSTAKIGDTTIVFPGGLYVQIKQQLTDTVYGTYTVYALGYRNHIYNGQYTMTLVGGANTTTEDYEKIIIPLNYQILDTMGLVDMNQLTNYTGHMVFNCYDKVKSKWYESGILNLALIVTTVVVSVYTAGVGAAATGALGSAASIGAALGFSGALATLIGTVANGIAAMLIMKIFQEGATIVFGEQLGFIIGSIAGMVAIAYGGSIVGNQPTSGVFSKMMNPDSLLKLTSSVGQGYGEYLSENIQDIVNQSNALVQEADKINAQIEKLREQNLGNGFDVLNPLNFTDALAQAGEDRDSFLSRTLMSGVDIVQMSLKMLEQYPEISLSTELP